MQWQSHHHTGHGRHWRADISTVQQRTVRHLAATPHVKPTTTIAPNFDRSVIRQVPGLLVVTVRHGNKKTQATLYVVTDDMAAVAGRDLIQALGLSINSPELQVMSGTQDTTTYALRLPRQSHECAVAEDEAVELSATIATLQHGPMSLESIQQHTDADNVLSKVRKYIVSRWPNKKAVEPELLPYCHVRDELSLEATCITRGEHRFVIPASLQQRVLTAAHEGHPGIVRAKRQLRATYWWPGQDKDVEEFVRHCAACHDSAKAYKSTTVPPNNIPRPQEPWQKIALDICGPFAVAPRHQRFATVAIDYYSGFPEVLLSEDISSTRLIQWLTQLFARYCLSLWAMAPNSRQTNSASFYVSGTYGN